MYVELDNANAATYLIEDKVLLIVVEVVVAHHIEILWGQLPLNSFAADKKRAKMEMVS